MVVTLSALSRRINVQSRKIDTATSQKQVCFGTLHMARVASPWSGRVTIVAYTRLAWNPRSPSLPGRPVCRVGVTQYFLTSQAKLKKGCKLQTDKIRLIEKSYKPVIQGANIMKRKPAVVMALTLAFLLPSGFVMAANQATERERTQLQEQAQEQEHIYGSQMMTEQEREEFHARMRAAKTNEEREQIRMEHHKRMTERAKERGLSMPETPPPRGGGMGGGMGGGKGK
jgi:hypothetical protein